MTEPVPQPKPRKPLTDEQIRRLAALLRPHRELLLRKDP